jgi:fluoroacetyl-CoA thioesterase
VDIKEGLEATVSLVVGPDDTATAMGSGDVEVLATPRVVALCEEAAVTALRLALEDAQTTVGTRVVLDHIAPTLAGRSVSAHATLEHVDGRTLSFVVEVSDPAGVIARGTHTRVIVDRERFLKGAADRA